MGGFKGLDFVLWLMPHKEGKIHKLATPIYITSILLIWMNKKIRMDPLSIPPLLLPTFFAIHALLLDWYKPGKMYYSPLDTRYIKRYIYSELFSQITVLLGLEWTWKYVLWYTASWLVFYVKN